MAGADAFPDNVIYYGEEAILPPVIPLRAGFLEMIYEAGALRYIKSGGQELLRMIYVALRDTNWGTYVPHISDEKIEKEQDSFRISYTCSYFNNGLLLFTWQALITGEASGTIYFEMKGQAKADFKKNRLGFCVLHPISECQGIEVKIIHPDTSFTAGKFPVSISPHQPFKNIKQMQWQLENGTSATLTFAGDIFEMEDQRNWTDASYKTYCTPLEISFPAEVKKGQELFQSVRLEVEAHIKYLSPAQEYSLKAEWNATSSPKFPRIGIGRSSEYENLSSEEIEKIKACRFSHYRVEIVLHTDEWKKILEQATLEAINLELGLEIALDLDEKANRAELFLSEGAKIHSQISSVVLFFPAKTSDPILEERLIVLFKQQLPDSIIGVGKKGFFAELNRSRPATTAHDFIAFPVNPQVHAFDYATLTENLEAQAFVVNTAKAFFQNKPIHISPVTLRPKLDSKFYNSEVLPFGDDPRQMSLFTAGWTVGSVKYLSEAGAASITYFETVGKKGIMAGKNEIDNNSFPAFPGMLYPAFYIFKEIAEFHEAEVIPCSTSFPLQLSTLLLKTASQFKLLMANHTPSTLAVSIAGLGKMWKAKVLDKNSFKQLMTNSSTIEGISVFEATNSIELPPFAIAFLEAEKTK